MPPCVEGRHSYGTSIRRADTESQATLRLRHLSTVVQFWAQPGELVCVDVVMLYEIENQ